MQFTNLMASPYEKQPLSALQRPDIWRVPLPERLLRERVNDVVLDVLLEATPILWNMVDRGVGRKVTSLYVPGRQEDEELEIDIQAENIIISILGESAEKNGLSLLVLSEHNNFVVGKESPNAIVVDDPFDNSSEYKRGLNTPPHFVFAFYTTEGIPIAAGDADLFTQHIYINRDGKNYYYNPRTRSLIEIETSLQQRVKTIQDSNFVIASYLGADEYARPFNAHFDKLNQDRHPKSRLHGKGGSHLYGSSIATGAVSAYIMFNEPRGEIDPGLPFALSAGYSIVSVNPDGGFEDYRFDSNLQREDVPLFITAATPELRDEIIRYYLEGQKAA